MPRAFPEQMSASSASISLPGSGAACAIRAVPPKRQGGAGYRSFLIADKENIKRVEVDSFADTTAALVESFVTSDTPPNWIDVDIDPVGNGRTISSGVNDGVDTNDFWAVSDGKAINANTGESLLAKFRTTNPRRAPPPVNSALTRIDLGSDRPQGVTLNGALRAGQTTWVGTFSDNTITSTAKFLQKTMWEHWYTGKTTASPSPQMAVQVFEVTSDETGDSPNSTTLLCDPSLDVDCRIFKNFHNGTVQNAIGKEYSRGRKVVYREIPLVNTATNLEVAIKVPSFITVPGPGTQCNVNTFSTDRALQTATALLRDPWKHDFFELDFAAVIFPDPTYYGAPSLGNDSLVANRNDALSLGVAEKTGWKRPPKRRKHNAVGN